MRTATLILLLAVVPIFAAPQDRAKSKSEGTQNSAMPPGAAPRFEAIPASVTAGQATQLTWTVEGATSVNIQPVVGSVPASGSAPVTPGETTTYTLTAVLPSGNVTATTTVTVALAGPGTTPPSTELPSPATTSPSSMAVPAPSAATSAMPEAPKATAPTIDPTKMGAPRDGTTKPPAKVDDHAFILGAEDQIAISVYGSPEFSGSHMIRPDGKITLNFIGEVTATDLTPEQLSNEIKERIKKYIVDPDVSVQVLAVRSKKYFIQGEVGRTGEFPLTVPTRVLEALVNAGGFKDFANKKNIIIMRGTDMRGTQRIRFNYNEVIKGKHLEQNIYLQPGDIILVR
uniref:Polysaccharide export protein n=1 Tax=Solibacter usitatus (strain Ellin6076) TaxID=234267 RepID=Q028C0_SOLUE